MATTPVFGEIYVHTNVLNGKSYVGQTTVGMAKRWALHLRCAQSVRTPAYKTVFSKAIRKYGAEIVFRRTIFFLSLAQLARKEKEHNG
jgi:hypothetical protein